MYAKAKGKGMKAKLRNVTNRNETKLVLYEEQYKLEDEFHCDKGYVADAKYYGRKDNKNRCKDNDTSYNYVGSCNDDDTYKNVDSCKYDDTSYKDVGPCKDDDTSYKDVGSCKKRSTLCRNDIMKSPIGPKSPMWPRRKIDDSDGNRKLTADKSYNHDGSCRDDSTSCRNNIMKSRMWPKRDPTKIDGDDGGRSLTGTNDDIIVIDVINLCSSDDNDEDTSDNTKNMTGSTDADKPYAPSINF